MTELTKPMSFMDGNQNRWIIASINYFDNDFIEQPTPQFVTMIKFGEDKFYVFRAIDVIHKITIRSLIRIQNKH